MIRTYQRRNKGGSNSQPDAFSPFESDSQDLIGSYHSQLSSQEGNAALEFSDPLRASQQPPVARLGSLSSRLDLFAFEDDEEEDAFGQTAPPERQSSGLTRRGSQGGSPAKKPPREFAKALRKHGILFFFLVVIQILTCLSGCLIFCNWCFIAPLRQPGPLRGHLCDLHTRLSFFW